MVHLNRSCRYTYGYLGKLHIYCSGLETNVVTDQIPHYPGLALLGSLRSGCTARTNAPPQASVVNCLVECRALGHEAVGVGGQTSSDTAWKVEVTTYLFVKEHGLR